MHTRPPVVDDPASQVIETTRTLCPHCLRALDGTVVAMRDQVWLTRHCPEHGETRALVMNHARHYHRRADVPHPPLDDVTRGPAGAAHPSCIALLEITDACNLACAACYAQSPAGKHRSFDELARRLRAFIEQRGPLQVLQISGGEPLLHPELLRILDHAKRLPIDHVMINTNGLELARHPTLAVELAKRTPRLEVYLQMDGLDPATHVALRGRDLIEHKRAALAALVDNGIPVTLVCTVVAGVNDHEIGDVLRLGAGIPLVRGVSFQPATFAGRFQLAADPQHRMTLGDVIAHLDAQTDGQFTADDFRPLPCSHPNCCSFTFATRPADGTLTPLPRLVDVDAQLPALADRIAFTLDDASGCCGIGTGTQRTTPLPAQNPASFFRVVVKPFMDAHTYDQKRIDECCVHIIDDAGRGVSFCEYNVLRRADDLVRLSPRSAS